jgi:hypothetical protein
MDAFNALKQADEVRTFPNIDMPAPLHKPNARATARLRATEKVRLLPELLSAARTTHMFTLNITAQKLVLQQLIRTKEGNCDASRLIENKED